VLGLPAETLARSDRVIALAESALAAPAASFAGEEFYPEFTMKAAVLCSHLVRNHPLPDGNKRTAYLCLVEFVERNGYGWRQPTDEAVDALFHYTSGDGLKGIVDKGLLRATDVTFLNDESEWVYARELVGKVLDDFAPGPVPAAQQLLESLRKEIPQCLERVRLWAVCFCTKGNLLSM